MPDPKDDAVVDLFDPAGDGEDTGRLPKTEAVEIFPVLPPARPGHTVTGPSTPPRRLR